VIVYLDTETTGLSAASGDTIVEIAIVDHNGRPLIDTLVNPQRAIPWQATKVHGIRDDMVRGKPTLGQILPDIRNAIRGKELVIYNASFDVSFFANRLADAAAVRCAMKAFNAARGGRPHKLATAAEHVGHAWSGTAHRALADALACRSVWEWLLRQKRPQPDAPPTPTLARVPVRPPPVAPPPVAVGERVVTCLRCAERYVLPESSRDDPTCPNCRQIFKTAPAQLDRGGETPSKEAPVPKPAEESSGHSRIPKALYRQVSWNPPKIAFLCCYCGAEGIDDDSHLVRCDTCNRWMFTRQEKHHH
jgi:DNA polymerase-3 subunit epsilon